MAQPTGAMLDGLVGQAVVAINLSALPTELAIKQTNNLMELLA